MVLASSPGAPPPGWLDVLGKVAGVLLTLELLVVLIVLLALMVALAFAARWVHQHVVPVVRDNTPKVQQAMQVADKSTDRVVSGIAEFYGRRQAVETGVRVFLFGKKAARRVHDASLVQADADLQLIEESAATEKTLPGPENGFTPRMRVVSSQSAEADGRRPSREQDRTPDRGDGYGGYGQLAGNAG
jgi:hypothetical protein